MVNAYTKVQLGRMAVTSVNERWRNVASTGGNAVENRGQSLVGQSTAGCKHKTQLCLTWCKRCKLVELDQNWQRRQ